MSNLVFYAQSAITVISARERETETDRQTDRRRQRETGRNRDGERE